MPFAITQATRGCETVDPSQAVALISFLLEAAGWDADEFRIRAALPHAKVLFDGFDLYATIQALRVPVIQENAADAQNATEVALGIIVSEDASFRLAGSYFGNGATDVHVKAGETRLLIQPAGFTGLTPETQNVGTLLATLRGQIWPLLLSSFAIHIVGLLTPIFVMLVYNRAIPAGSVNVIAALGIGLILAFGTEIIIRIIRNQIVLELSSGAEHYLSLALLKKLMIFPHDLLVGSSIDQQRARLKQFEGLREAIMGPLVQVGLDLPFIIIFGILLFFIAPPVGMVVTFALFAQLAFMFGFAPLLRKQERNANNTAREMRQVCETIVNDRLYLRRTQAKGPWREKFYRTTSDALTSVTRLQFLVELSAHIAQFIILVAGATGGLLATHMAIEGSLSIGGFVAILVVIWRFLAPVQSIASAVGQATALRQSIVDMNAILAMPGEKYRGVEPRAATIVAPPVVVEQASIRFLGNADLTITGASLRLVPGKVTVLSGPNLAGKTVLAEAIAGLHSLVSGRVLFNGTDQRQIPVDDLRRRVAFAAQRPVFLYGTILQNFELALPGVEYEQVVAALEEAGVRREVDRLPEGLKTRLNNENMAELPHDLKQGLSIARALLQPGPVRIFDQPTEGLDLEHAEIVRRAIRNCRVDSAILLVSNTTADLELGDSFITLQHGRIIQSGQGPRGFEKARAFLDGNLDTKK